MEKNFYEKNLSRLILIILNLVVFLWIFTNKFTDSAHIVKEKPVLVSNINGLFASMNLSYMLVARDVASTIRFTEYLVFGITLMMMLKLYVKNIAKNVAVLLFSGLFTAVLEVYFKTVQKTSAGIDEIIISFLGFCIGIGFCFVFSKITFSGGPTVRKYRSSKYNGRY